MNPAFSLSMSSNGSSYTVGTFSNPASTNYLWLLDGAPAGTGTTSGSSAQIIPLPTTTTTTAGNHTICLRLWRGNTTLGITCERTVCKMFTILPTNCLTATAKFAATINTAGPTYNVVFNGTLSSNASNYAWAGYGAGVGTTGTPLWTATTASPTYNYAAAGIYWACLTVNAGTACEVKTCMPMSIGSMTCNNVTPPANRTSNPTNVLVSDEVMVETAGMEPLSYPNPTNGQLTVQLNRFANQTTVITLTDLSGRTLATQKTEAGQPRTNFDLADLPTGMYIIAIQAHDGTRSLQKIVKE